VYLAGLPVHLLALMVGVPGHGRGHAFAAATGLTGVAQFVLVLVAVAVFFGGILVGG
jgi:hypothetical protein